MKMSIQQRITNQKNITFINPPLTNIGVRMIEDDEINNEKTILDLNVEKQPTKYYKDSAKDTTISNTLKKLNEIANAYAKIYEPFSIIGYADYAETEYEAGFTTYENGELSLIMEWQAENEDEAEEVAELLSSEVSLLLKKEVKFSVVKDLWGVCSDGWYVTIDTEIPILLED